MQYGYACRLLAGAATAALLFSVISGVLLSQGISRGLRRAISLAEAVALGEVHTKVAASGNDEIKDLIESLNLHDRQSLRHGRHGWRYRGR